MTLIQTEPKKLYIRVDVQPVTTAGIYHNPSLGLISLSSDGTNWITIADKNLGATQVYNSGDTLSQANCGYYYQRGNNYGFAWTGTVNQSSTQVNAQNYGPGNYYYSIYFCTNNLDWSSVRNDNLWGGTTGTVEAMQGPCPTGFHVPTIDEWTTILDIGTTLSIWSTSSGDNLKSYLKLPFSGDRASVSSNTENQGTVGNYWSCSPGEVNGQQRAWRFYASSSLLSVGGRLVRVYGLTIRPFANTPVQPNDSWTVLYPTS